MRVRMWWLVILFSGMALLMCAAWFWLTSSWLESRSQACAQHLNELGGRLHYTPDQLAPFFASPDPWAGLLADYASRHPSSWDSDRLAVLVKGCPSTGPRQGPSYEVNRRLGEVLQRRPNLAKVPLFWDRYGNHEPKVCVFFADRHGERLDRAEFEEMTAGLR